MKAIKLLFFAFALLAGNILTAQVAINTDSAIPDSSAMLDVKSTEKGVLIPRMTAEQRNAIVAPAEGLLVYQSDDPIGFYFFKSGEWTMLTEGAHSWAADGENIHNTNTGLVGIGTDNPASKLDVRGSNTNDGALFSLGNSDESHKLVLFGGREEDPNPFIFRKAGDPLRFSTNENGWTEQLRIEANGNVGIGTNITEPSAKLEVNSTSGGFLPPRMTAAERDAIFEPATGLLIFSNTDSLYYSNKGTPEAPDWKPMVAWAANGDNISNTNTGMVGIGTTSPNAKLDVRGNAPDDGVIISLGNANESHKLSFFSGHANDPNPYIFRRAGDPLRFATDENGWTEQMRIEGNGNVGIGTTTPGAKLDVRSSAPDNDVAISLANADESHKLSFFGGHANDPNPYIFRKAGDPLRFSTDENGWTEQMRIEGNGNVGIGTNATEPSAKLEVNSTSGGFLPPRMTSAQRDAISNPVAGLRIWCTDCSFYGENQTYNGSFWENDIGEITSEPWECGDAFKDFRDGKSYSTVLIYDQCWFAENLNIGTQINVSEDMTDDGVIQKYCYDNDENNCNTYGGLYQWDEMMQYVNTEAAQGICPAGWHIPAHSEWTTLVTYVGNIGYPGSEGTALKSTNGWNNNGNGTDDFGFTALPGGVRKYTGTNHFNGEDGVWWSSSPTAPSEAWYHGMYFNRTSVYHTKDDTDYGFSVRCLYDETFPVPLNIGVYHQGGIIAYIFQPGDPGYVEGETHGLIAAPSDQGYPPWGCQGDSIQGADGTALGTGAQNTIDIVTGCAEANIAARICNDLVLNGYDDWFLPSKDELNKLYLNQSLIGGFETAFYWSSTEFNDTAAWDQFFGDGGQYVEDKSISDDYVRAVRVF